MKKGSVYSCSSCNKWYTVEIDAISLLVCDQCFNIVYQNALGITNVPVSKVPEDWSFIKLGTMGEFERQPFKIVGRVRLQLRNDYKNFWCGAYADGKSFWLVESFGSFSAFSGAWHWYTGDPIKLRANVNIPIDPKNHFRGEYVEKCEDLSYEGQVGEWKLFSKGFFLVQASVVDGRTAIFTIPTKENIQFLLGEKISMDRLFLKNIYEWNEWK